MTVRACYLITAVLAMGHFCSALDAQGYTFQVVDFCDGYATFPEAINNQGTIVGGAYNSGMKYSLAFVYSNGACKVISLGAPGTSFSGINDDGDVLGLYGNLQNYLYKDGASRSLLSYPGVENTYYCCLSTATGMLAGNYLMPASSEGYGFLYDKGAFRPLPDTDSLHVPSITGMNKKGIVVGTMNSANQPGFAYFGGKMHYFQYPGATYTTFNGINDDDLIVGTWVFFKEVSAGQVAGTGTEGVFSYNLDTGIWTDLQFPVQYNAVHPVGITNSGVIAAEYSPSGGLLIATPTN